MAEEKIIIRVDLDKKAAGARLVELEKEVLNYRLEQQELNKALKDGQISQTNYARRVLENKAGMAEAREEQKRLTAVTKAETGSINALRVQLSALTKERNSTNQSTAEGVAAASKLDAQILSINQRLKQNEEASGQFQRNVGNYTKSIVSAADSTTVFGVNLGQARQAFVTANSAILTTNKSLNLLKIALISTGIGAIVVALGTLVSFFTNTQRGADKLSQALSVLRTALDVIRDRASAIGEGLVDIFWNGNIQSGWERLRQATSGVWKEIVDEGTKALDLEIARQKLAGQDVEFIRERARLLRELEQLQTRGEDTRTSALEREKLISQALQVNQQLTEKEVALQRERVRILEQQQALGESSLDDQRELATQQAELDTIIADRESLRRELINERNSIEREMIDAAKKSEAELLAQQKKAAEETKKLTQEELALKIVGLEEEINKERDNMSKKLQLNKELVDAKLEQSLLGVDAQSNAELVAIREANLEKLKLDQEYLDAKKQQQLDFEQLLAEDIEQFNKDTTQTVRTSVANNLEEKNKEKDAALIAEQTKQQAVIQTSNVVAGAAEEGTVVQKAAAVTSTLASTWQAATAAVTPPPTGLGPLAGIPLAVATTAFGLLNAGKILKLSRGGLIDGPGTATSDSIHLMGSKGESMINARSTAMFLPQLSAINVAGGGVPLTNKPIPKTHYSRGGVIAVENRMRDTQMQSEILYQLRNQPAPILRYKEFVKFQERYDKKVKITNI